MYKITQKPFFWIQWLVSLLLLFSLSCTTAEHPEESRKELIEKMNAFNIAFKEGAVDQLALMITDNYQHTNGSSKAIGREAWLNYLLKRKKELENGGLTVNDYEMQETQVQIFGKTALVNTKIHVSGTKKGEAFENEYRVTNVWVKEGSEWKRAGFHDGKIR